MISEIMIAVENVIYTAPKIGQIIIFQKHNIIIGINTNISKTHSHNLFFMVIPP